MSWHTPKLILQGGNVLIYTIYTLYIVIEGGFKKAAKKWDEMLNKSKREEILKSKIKEGSGVHGENLCKNMFLYIHNIYIIININVYINKAVSSLQFL